MSKVFVAPQGPGVSPPYREFSLFEFTHPYVQPKIWGKNQRDSHSFWNRMLVRKSNEFLSEGFVDVKAFFGADVID